MLSCHGQYGARKHFSCLKCCDVRRKMCLKTCTAKPELMPNAALSGVCLVMFNCL